MDISVQREWMTCREAFNCFLNMFHFGYISTSTNEGARESILWIGLEIYGGA